MENVKKLFRCISVLTLILLCSAFSANAENVSGTVVDDTGEAPDRRQRYAQKARTRA